MAALTHYAKIDATVRTTTSTTAVEITQYTVAWADLTGAGFSAGDDVMVICQAGIGADATSSVVSLALGTGTTFAGIAFLTNSFTRVEVAATGVTDLHNYFYIKRHTLVVNENFYTTLQVAAGTGRVDDYSLMFLRLNDLTENVDFKYATATHSGNAAIAYDTSGASVTIPSASQNWLALANCFWLVDEIDDSDFFTALQVDGVDQMELRTEGEDLIEQISHGIIDALVSPANGATIRVRYRTDDGTSHDASETKLFLLRLGVFENSDLVKSTSTITHSVVDTLQEFAGFSFSLTTTGDVAFFAQSRHVFTDPSKAPYGQLQLANADIVSGYRRTAAKGNGALDQASVTYAVIAAQTAGTLDIDFDIAEDTDVTPSYNANEHAAVVFSLQLAPAASTVNPYPYVGGGYYPTEG